MGSLCSRESRYKKQSTLVHSTSHKPNIVQPQPSCQHMSSHIYPAQTITSVTTQIVSMFLHFYRCNYSKVANMDLQFLRFYVFLVTEFIYASVHMCLAFVAMYETVDRSPHLVPKVYLFFVIDRALPQIWLISYPVHTCKKMFSSILVFTG